MEFAATQTLVRMVRGLMKIKYFACVDVILIVLLHTY